MCMVIVRQDDVHTSFQRVDMPGEHYIFDSDHDDDEIGEFARDISIEVDSWEYAHFSHFYYPSGPVIGYYVDGEYYVR